MLYQNYGEIVESTKHGPICLQPTKDLEGMPLHVPIEQRDSYIGDCD